MAHRYLADGAETDIPPGIGKGRVDEATVRTARTVHRRRSEHPILDAITVEPGDPGRNEVPTGREPDQGVRSARMA